MPNAYGKSIDKTFLSVDLAEERGFIHRDYIGHVFRWTHIVKFLSEKKRYTEAHILDLGCGRETPLLKTVYSSRLIPLSYMGVDVGPINDPSEALKQKFSVNLWPHTNILDVSPVKGFTVIIMFEALEHMEPNMGRRVLEHIQKFMEKDTTFFLSTPCYDGVNKANNHVYEWDYHELREQLETLNYNIVNVWGTFASIKDYKPLLTNGALQMFEQLREYYDSNVLSTIFAPMFPANSRNAIWQLTI